MSLEDSAGLGVLNNYGQRKVSDTGKYGGSISAGKVHTLVYQVTYDDLPGGSTVDFQAKIPSGAMVVEAYFNTTTAFAGGTSYDIGLEESDGSTAIDADGLFDALVLADIDASVAGSLTASEHAGTNSGVLVGQRLSVDGYLVMAATGTFTAGAAEVVIEYIL